MAKRPPFTFEAKVDALRRIRVGGEDAVAVAESLGINRRQLYRWEKEEGVLDAATGGQEKPEPAKPPPTNTPLLNDIDLKKLCDGVRDGLRPDRAMRLVGRKPSTWKVWVETAEKGDEACRRVVEMVIRACAELERSLVVAIRKGGMGWQGAAWLLERLEPGTYSAEAAAEAAAGEQFTADELLTIIREAGLLA